MTETSTMMLGMSAGIHGVHQPGSIPFNTATYVLRAENARRRLDAEGTLIIVDKQVGADDSTLRQEIQHRTDRIRNLMQQHTALRVLTLSEICPDRLCTWQKRYPMEHFSTISHEGLRQYTAFQTALVLSVVECNSPSLASRYKFGWVAEKRKDKSPKGGEAGFDEWLPQDQYIQPLYTASGYDAKAKVTAPYLMQRGTEQTNLLIPKTRSGIVAEVDKMREGMALISLKTAYETSRVLLGEASPDVLDADDLVYAPLNRPQKRVLKTQDEILQLERDLEFETGLCFEEVCEKFSEALLLLT